MKFDKEKFSRQLKYVTRNMKISDYAEKCGISRSYISQYIGKHRDNPPKPEVLKNISDASEGQLDYEELMVAAGYLEQKYYDERKNMLKIVRHLRENNKLPKGLKDDLKQNEILPDYEELLPVYDFENRLIWENQTKRERKSHFRSHLKEYFAKKIAEKSNYAVRLKDDKFNNLGIYKRDLLVVRIQNYKPNSGSIILVVIKTEEDIVKTIKRYYKLDNGKVHLDPSDNIKSIYDESEIRIIGVVIAMRRDLEV